MNNDTYKKEEILEILRVLAGTLDPYAGERKDNAEMDKLQKMLKEEGIPFQMEPDIWGNPHLKYCGKEGQTVCSVIYGYGQNEGLLEIQGLMTEEEYNREGDTVLGYLTAENIFERIRRHWKKA